METQALFHACGQRLSEIQQMDKKREQAYEELVQAVQHLARAFADHQKATGDYERYCNGWPLEESNRPANKMFWESIGVNSDGELVTFIHSHFTERTNSKHKSVAGQRPLKLSNLEVVKTVYELLNCKMNS